MDAHLQIQIAISSIYDPERPSSAFVGLKEQAQR
jgi:hypothetical protein